MKLFDKVDLQGTVIIRRLRRNLNTCETIVTAFVLEVTNALGSPLGAHNETRVFFCEPDAAWNFPSTLLVRSVVRVTGRIKSRGNSALMPHVAVDGFEIMGYNYDR